MRTRAPSLVFSLLLPLSGLACSGGDKPADPAAPKAEAEAEAAAQDKADKPPQDGAAAATGEALAPSGAATAPTGSAETGESAGAAFDSAALAALKPIGIEFCDAYIEAYRKCITFTVPAEEKAAHAGTLIHEHENWARTKAGAAEVASEALQIGCRSAQAQAAQKTQALNCAWPS